MAYIYRYQIRKKNCRSVINLTNFKDAITQDIRNLFSENLKDIRITDKFFEFKLYISAENDLLREMGRRLKYVWYDYHEYKNGFIRVPQKLYALIYPAEEQDSSMFYVEFIDAMDIEEMERFSEQANNYLLEYMKENDTRNRKQVIDKSIQCMFYLDVINTNINKKNVLIAQTPKKELRCFLVQGYHRVINNDMMESEESITIKDNNYEFMRERIYFNESIDVACLRKYENLKYHKKQKHQDCFDVINYSEVDKGKINEIFNKLDYYISETVKIEELDNIHRKDDLVFCVHNVGQGLATSLSTNGNCHHLFFDYGMAEGENLFTEPESITAHVNSDTTIILSHIHRDHWYRLVKDINAFECKWFIPNQEINFEFRHRCAEIIATGGNVYKVMDTINFIGGSLFYGPKSKFDPVRMTSHKHETGLALRLEMQNEKGEDINILIAGDQWFDYMEDEYLINIDILVACHHGGKYSWSKRANVVEDIPIPRDTETATIVYSFGMGKDGRINTHKHPSKVNEYQSRGWKNEYHTSISGDYTLSINSR